MEATEIGSAIIPSPPTTRRATIMAEALKQDTEQRNLLAAYVKQHMIEGTDFGKIPGTDKPSLLKPGAEKLTDLFRCTPKFTLIKDEEDFERGFFNYKFRVRIVSRDSGEVLAEGFGSANSREGRYRWRNAQPKCPACGKETLNRSKHKAEFYCWAKKGGCGATFPLTDKRVTEQAAGKVENDDIATLANTILKMAKKRALVDGAIALARCSDMFTQDVEDFEHPVEESAAPQPSAEKPAPASAPKPGPSPAPAQAEAKPTPPPAPKAPAPGEPPEVDKLAIAIEEAQTKAELDKLLPRLKRLPEAQKKLLHGPFSKRTKEVAQ